MVGDNCIQQDLAVVDVYTGDRGMSRVSWYEVFQEAEEE